MGLLTFALHSSSGSNMMAAILGIAILAIVILVVGILITFVATLFTVGGLVFASAQTYIGEQVTAVPHLGKSGTGFGLSSEVILFWLLIIGLLTITIVGIPFAIYFAMRWVFSSLAVLVEGHSAINALRRSSELVKGAWWRIAGITIAILLLAFIIQSILQFSLLFVFGLTQSTGGDGDLLEMIRQMFLPELTTWASLVTNLIQNAISHLVASLMLPIGVIGSTLLYFDQRIRKEGFDIEMRVSNARGVRAGQNRYGMHQFGNPMTILGGISAFTHRDVNSLTTHLAT